MGANLKEVRERMKSVKNTQQITKAMKMVSAAKLRRAQQAIVQLRPYSNKLNEMLSNILTALGNDANTSFGVERPVQNALVVVVTSNKGLCGAFNTNICKAAAACIDTKYADLLAKGKVSILFVGKKGFDYFKRRYQNVTFINDYTPLFNDLSFANTSKVADGIMADFQNGKYDAVDIVYAEFRNAALQNFKVEPYLPVPKKESTEATGGKKNDFIFEPNKAALLEYLVPNILQTQFQKTLLDTHASEHGARMTAMESATENANDLLKELKLGYNKARQEAITRELSEIVGGAAALGG